MALTESLSEDFNLERNKYPIVEKMTVPNRPVILERILWRLGFPTYGYNPRPRKTPLKTSKPKKEVELAPVVTFGSNELSARRYNAPQLNVTPERLEKLKIELQKEAQAEEEKRAAAIETYEMDLERLKSQKTEFNGLGLTSENIKRMVREWEAEQKRALAHLKVEIPYGNSPIKTCSN